MKETKRSEWKPEVVLQGVSHVEDDGKDVYVCTPDGDIKLFQSSDRGRDLAQEHARKWFESHAPKNKLGVGKIVWSDSIAGPGYGDAIVAKDNTPVAK